jgi:hypothetical protein
VITRVKIPEEHVRLRYTYFDTKNYQRSEKPQRRRPPLTRYIPYYYNTKQFRYSKTISPKLHVTHVFFTRNCIDIVFYHTDYIGKNTKNSVKRLITASITSTQRRRFCCYCCNNDIRISKPLTNESETISKLCTEYRYK